MMQEQKLQRGLKNRHVQLMAIGGAIENTSGICMRTAA